MDIKRLLTSLSNRILTQFAIVIVVVLALIAFNFGSIYPFYAENQLTSTGLIINSAIVALFLLGIGSILLHLLRYRREEAAIATFINNVEALKPGLLRRRARQFDHRATPWHHAHDPEFKWRDQPQCAGSDAERR